MYASDQHPDFVPSLAKRERGGWNHWVYIKLNKSTDSGKQITFSYRELSIDVAKLTKPHCSDTAVYLAWAKWQPTVCHPEGCRETKIATGPCWGLVMWLVPFWPAITLPTYKALQIISKLPQPSMEATKSMQKSVSVTYAANKLTLFCCAKTRLTCITFTMHLTS